MRSTWHVTRITSTRLKTTTLWNDLWRVTKGLTTHTAIMPKPAAEGGEQQGRKEGGRGLRLERGQVPVERFWGDRRGHSSLAPACLSLHPFPLLASPSTTAPARPTLAQLLQQSNSWRALPPHHMSAQLWTSRIHILYPSPPHQVCFSLEGQALFMCPCRMVCKTYIKGPSPCSLPVASTCVHHGLRYSGVVLPQGREDLKPKVM